MKLLDDGAEAAMVMQCELCEIPAPTFHEEVRVAEIVRRMKALGLKDVHVDEIGNVIGRRPGRGDGPVLAIGAHMDTVFPEGTPIKAPPRRRPLLGARHRRQLLRPALPS